MKITRVEIGEGAELFPVYDLEAVPVTHECAVRIQRLQRAVHMDARQRSSLADLLLRHRELETFSAAKPCCFGPRHELT